jgi:hypothetical protein
LITDRDPGDETDWRQEPLEEATLDPALSGLDTYANGAPVRPYDEESYA